MESEKPKGHVVIQGIPYSISQILVYSILATKSVVELIFGVENIGFSAWSVKHFREMESKFAKGHLLHFYIVDQSKSVYFSVQQVGESRSVDLSGDNLVFM